MDIAESRVASIMRWSPQMVGMAAASAGLLAVALIGLVADQRTITGAPAWLKPAKFAASGTIYLLSLAWMVRDLPRSRLLRVATTLIAWIITGETVVISLQAARGTTSHFNVDTPFDAAIFASMGVGIGTVWVMSAVLLWLHWRTPTADRAMALALRWGLLLNIAGAGVGWRMTQPSPAQLSAMERGERPFVVGSHTVGGPDGGRGIPLLRWSADHGDLRVPHFLGMHALQLLPLALLGLRRVRRERNDATERGAVFVTALGCSIAFTLAFVQAQAGHPLISRSVGGS
jgi:hypothetical protein